MMERLRESRWVYILLSVLLAVVFWLYIRDTEDHHELSPSTTSRSRSPTSGYWRSGD